MIILSQVFLGESGGYDLDGNELPRLVYVSREKRPSFNHQRKAGGLNALVSHTYLKNQTLLPFMQSKIHTFTTVSELELLDEDWMTHIPSSVNRVQNKKS